MLTPWLTVAEGARLRAIRLCALRDAQLQLSVNDDNVAAIALYTRKGFEPSRKVGALPPPREHLRRHDRILKLQ